MTTRNIKADLLTTLAEIAGNGNADQMANQLARLISDLSSSLVVVNVKQFNTRSTMPACSDSRDLMLNNID